MECKAPFQQLLQLPFHLMEAVKVWLKSGYRTWLRHERRVRIRIHRRCRRSWPAGLTNCLVIILSSPDPFDFMSISYHAVFYQLRPMLFRCLDQQTVELQATRSIPNR